MPFRLKSKKAISLVEVLIAMAVLSTLALPMSMFLIEYTRGSSELGDYYQILNQVEERLNIAMSMPFNRIPIGISKDVLIDNPFNVDLDLKQKQIAKNLVSFKLKVETLPAEFSAYKDSFSGILQRARVEEGLKKLIVSAEWGDDNRHHIELVAYRANL
ncbi:MAG: type IV pilus modification PilV family protein [Candidatus Rifleibacteriota bacterium]